MKGHAHFHYTYLDLDDLDLFKIVWHEKLVEEKDDPPPKKKDIFILEQNVTLSIDDETTAGKDEPIMLDN